MSLSSWLRDYLYIALGGNRNGAWKTYRNLFLTMAIAGLWHGGDSWNYLLWGAAHGVALCVDRLWSRSSLPRIPSWLSHTLTLLFVFMAWTLFRAPDFAAALNMYAGQLGLHDFALGDGLAVTLRSALGARRTAWRHCWVWCASSHRCSKAVMNNALLPASGLRRWRLCGRWRVFCFRSR